MPASAITAIGLGKSYLLGERQSFGAFLARRAAGADAGQNGSQLLWALRDVSFEVQPGEIIGIIGGNGAGKSTLLKILSRITQPTSGRAVIHGRVGSLLEVGTGFHPELTGRENIYVNGAILGMRRADIRRCFDEIVAFSEIDRFLDTPVKRYSSGMYTRLAFAVAAHLQADILIVDEVLAVGDAAFQRKCLSKMGDVAMDGRTVLFVSHRMEAIRRLCGKAFLLERGSISYSGDTQNAIDRYLHNVELHALLPDRGSAPHKVMHLRSARLQDADGSPITSLCRGDALRVELTYEINRPVQGAHVFARVQTSEDLTVFSTGDCDVSGTLAASRAPGAYVARFDLPTVLFNEGEYFINFALGIPFLEVFDSVPEALRFHVRESPARRGPGYLKNRPGVVIQDIEWTTAPAPVDHSVNRN